MTLTLSDANELVNLIEAIDDPAQSYLYVAIVDTVTCSTCLGYEQLVFTHDEIPLEFPDAYPEGDMLHANTHMTLWGKDTCRCLLVPYDLGDEDTQAVTTNSDGDLVNKQSSDSLPTRISDAKYEDLLNALFDAGIISLVVYQGIMDRRKKNQKPAPLPDEDPLQYE